MSTDVTPTPKKKYILYSVAGLILLIGIFLAFRYVTEWRFQISTDDAYIQGDITAIAPKVSGYIKEVNITANQEVKQNDVLFTLDDGDYRLALDDADAKLVTQARTLERIKAQISAARTSLDEAEATHDAAVAVKTNADLTLNRAQTLQQSQSVSQSMVDAAQSSLDQAAANVTRASAQIAAAKANILVLQAQYNEAESATKSIQVARAKAKRDLDFTVIRAPIDGIIGNLSSQKGDLVVNGQQLAALVPNKSLYIDANYKETQIAEIFGGETAHITIDGFEGDGFEGKVLSLSPASGAVFSILPPQNATGNFTKIVQRIPVRISIPEEILKTGRIRAGMSVHVIIDTRTKPK
ncbi:HlyD family secretion protein [Bartonella sp. HY329]|uniref:HlyD family secretion protein n=1 Tax=unclassified Bartonella TaxID=2645622 RepID=UPI0021C59671|nr:MULTISPECIES: HlyD family secretion protein [unclassified Bartonella]UXM95528.1 HlyD family secretion protein [Bartonella sp. HY329]UXN09853.1 HlyD family secretion protein [Bartonella sp. HY328]